MTLFPSSGTIYAASDKACQNQEDRDKVFQFYSLRGGTEQKISSGKEEWWHHLSIIFTLKLERAFWSIVAQKGSNILQLCNT